MVGPRFQNFREGNQGNNTQRRAELWTDNGSRGEGGRVAGVNGVVAAEGAAGGRVNGGGGELSVAGGRETGGGGEMGTAEGGATRGGGVEIDTDEEADAFRGEVGAYEVGRGVVAGGSVAVTGGRGVVAGETGINGDNAKIADTMAEAARLGVPQQWLDNQQYPRIKINAVALVKRGLEVFNSLLHRLVQEEGEEEGEEHRVLNNSTNLKIKIYFYN